MTFTQRIDVLRRLVAELRRAEARIGHVNPLHAANAVADHLDDFTRIDGMLRGLMTSVHEQTGVLPIADIEKRRAAVAMHVLDFFAAAVNVSRDPRSVAKILDTDQLDAIIAAALGVSTPIAAYREYRREHATRAPDAPTDDELRRARALSVLNIQDSAEKLRSRCTKCGGDGLEERFGGTVEQCRTCNGTGVMS